MFLIYGKRFIFLAVFAVLTANTAAAQQVTARQKNSIGEREVAAPEILRAKIEQQPPVENALILDAKVAPEINFQPKIKDIKYQFRKVATKKRNFNFDGGWQPAEIDLKTSDANVYLPGKDSDGEPRYVRETAPGRGFNYRGAFTQSLIFLAVQHGYATTQPKTQEALKHGAFWRDYADSVKSLRGWDDGGRFFTNYLAHPMQGAFTGHIYVQNSPQALREQFSMSPKYWKTRAKALLWTTAWSTQFEIGPISQASIGNVGLKGKQTWEDIIVTPTLGTAMLIAEDAIDQYVMKYIERNTSNRYVKIFARMLLNPTRNFSNLLRFREPWYRDRAMAR